MQYIVNTNDLCYLFKVTSTAIGQWVNKGMPKLAKNKFDLHLVWQWRYNQLADQNASDQTPYDLAATRLKEAQATIAELQVMNAQQQIILVRDVGVMLENYVLQVKNHFLNIPKIAAPKLVGETDLKEIKLTLDDVIRDILNTFEYNMESGVEALAAMEIDFNKTVTTRRKVKGIKANSNKSKERPDGKRKSK